LYHDKEERAGVKFKDMDLIGIPIRVTVGSKGIANNTFDIKVRGQADEIHVAIQDAPQKILKIRDELFRKINSRA